MNTSSKTRDLVLTAVITAIIVIMAFVSFLGCIPFGSMNAITVHIPMATGVIILEPKYRTFLGSTLGLTSLWKNIFMPNPTSLVSSPFVTMGQLHGSPGNLVIYLAPRILIGVVAYYVHRLFIRMLRNRRNKQGAALFAAGIAGFLINTPLAMNLIYLLFGDQYAPAASQIAKWVYGVILEIISMQGVSEALVVGIIVTAMAGILLKVTSDSRG